MPRSGGEDSESLSGEGFFLSRSKCRRAAAASIGITSDRLILEKAVGEGHTAGEGIELECRQRSRKATDCRSDDRRCSLWQSRQRAGSRIGAHDAIRPQDSARIAQSQHLRPFLAGLLALSQSQQQVSQRKAIIFFTSFLGAHIDLRTREAIDSIVGSANQAGESIYIIDVNSSGSTEAQLNTNTSQVTGFGGASISNMGATLGGTGLAQEGNLGNSDKLDNEVIPDDMKHLAQGTGGSYLDHNHLQKSLNRDPSGYDHLLCGHL